MEKAHFLLESAQAQSWGERGSTVSIMARATLSSACARYCWCTSPPISPSKPKLTQAAFPRAADLRAGRWVENASSNFSKMPRPWWRHLLLATSEVLASALVERVSRAARELGECSQQCSRLCARMLVGPLSSEERAHLTNQFSRGVGY